MAETKNVKYSDLLKGDAMQKLFKEQTIPAPFIVMCIENGILDCNDTALLFELEKSVGRHITPKNPPVKDYTNGEASKTPNGKAPSGGKVLGSSVPAFMKEAYPVGIHDLAVKEKDEKISKMGAGSDYDIAGHIRNNAEGEWCTPELMKALMMDKDRILEAKLRGAMYPAMVSFSIRTFINKDRTYQVPCITMMNAATVDGKWMPEKGMAGGGVTTFFLNKYGTVTRVRGNILETYKEEDFKSPQAVRNYMNQLEKYIMNRPNRLDIGLASKESAKKEWQEVKEFLEPYATGKKPIESSHQLMLDFMHKHKVLLGADIESSFMNLKTGETVNYIARHEEKEARTIGKDWYTCIDVTEACIDGPGDPRKLLIPGIFDKRQVDSSSRYMKMAEKAILNLNSKSLDACKTAIEKGFSGYSR